MKFYCFFEIGEEPEKIKKTHILITYNSFDDCIRCYQLADLIVYNFILNGNFITRFKLFRILLAYVFQLMIYTKRMTNFREDGLYSFNYRIIFIRNDSFYFAFRKSVLYPFHKRN